MNNKPTQNQYIKLYPFKGWVLNNFPFIAEDFDALTYYEMLCKIVQYLNNVIKNQNLVEEDMTKIYNAFNTLNDYVKNYFNNLDVQEEINNKLDAMAQDGTLENIIGDYLNKKPKLDFYGINIKGTSNSNCFIVQFKNGKNMFIDTGVVGEWLYIKNAIRDLNITKFDYGVITHFHGDHIGNLANFFDTFDLTECQIFTQATDIDWSKLPDYEVNFNEFKNIIESNHSSYTSPLHNTTTVIDEDTTIRWLNNNSAWYNDYINTISEYRETENTGNDFSLVCEIIHNNVKILSTGDIEYTAENNLKDYVTKCNLITGCHHLSNRMIAQQFFTNCQPDMCVSGTSKNNMGNTNINMKEYKFYLANGRPVYPLGYSLGSYTQFHSDGSSIQLVTPAYSKIYHNTSLFGSIYDVNNDLPVTINNLSLENVWNYMQDGDVLHTVVWQTYLPLWNELNEIFPYTFNGMEMELHKVSGGNHKYITIRSIATTQPLWEFTACIKEDLNDPQWNVIGYGTLPRIENYASLLETIAKLPQGKYNAQYNPVNDPTLINDGDSYVLDINIFTNINNNPSGNILFTPRGNSNKEVGTISIINNTLYYNIIPTRRQASLQGEAALLQFIQNTSYGVYPMYYTVSGNETWLDQDGDNYVLTITLTAKNNGTIMAIPRGKYTKAPVFCAVNNGVIHKITG